MHTVAEKHSNPPKYYFLEFSKRIEPKFGPGKQ